MQTDVRKVLQNMKCLPQYDFINVCVSTPQPFRMLKGLHTLQHLQHLDPRDIPCRRIQRLSRLTSCSDFHSTITPATTSTITDSVIYHMRLSSSPDSLKQLIRCNPHSTHALNERGRRTQESVKMHLTSGAYTLNKLIINQ